MFARWKQSRITAHAQETPCQFAKTLSSQSTLIFHVPIPLGHLDGERKLDAGGQWTHTRTTAKGPLAIGFHTAPKTIRPTQKKGLVLDVHEIFFDGYSYFQKEFWWQDTFTQPKKMACAHQIPHHFLAAAAWSAPILCDTPRGCQMQRASEIGPVIFHHMQWMKWKRMNWNTNKSTAWGLRQVLDSLYTTKLAMLKQLECDECPQWDFKPSTKWFVGNTFRNDRIKPPRKIAHKDSQWNSDACFVMLHPSHTPCTCSTARSSWHWSRSALPNHKLSNIEAPNSTWKHWHAISCAIPSQ